MRAGAAAAWIEAGRAVEPVGHSTQDRDLGLVTQDVDVLVDETDDVTRAISRPTAFCA